MSRYSSIVCLYQMRNLFIREPQEGGMRGGQDGSWGRACGWIDSSRPGNPPRETAQLASGRLSPGSVPLLN